MLMVMVSHKLRTLTLSHFPINKQTFTHTNFFLCFPILAYANEYTYLVIFLMRIEVRQLRNEFKIHQVKDNKLLVCHSIHCEKSRDSFIINALYRYQTRVVTTVLGYSMLAAGTANTRPANPSNHSLS